MDIRNKAALITGGAVRVGRAITLELVRRGAAVAVNYNSSGSEALELCRTIEDAGGRAIAIKADVSLSGEVEALVRTASERLGGLDILVNNSAVFYPTDFLTVSEEDWDRFMDINLKGAFLCSQHAARGMVERGSGKIVSIVDVGAFKPWKDYVPYCVSKAALDMLTRGMAKALAPSVQVNAVAPGPVLLPEDYDEIKSKAAAKRTLLGRLGTPEDIARAVCFLVESDYITGETLFVDGGSKLV